MANCEQVPWTMDPIAQSGFLVQTEVKASNVKGAGRARFVSQSVNKGALVRVTRLVDAKQGKPAPGTTLVSTPRQMLEKAMHYDDVPGLPSNNEQIVNFAGTPYNVEQGNNASFHWTPCNFFNHSRSPNVVISLPPEEDGHVYVVALRDIAAGEELFQDYREFKLPEWFMNMCEEWSLTSTQSLGAQLDGMDSFKSAGDLGKVSLLGNCAQVPWTMDPIAQSGFLVQTEVKASNVKGAGRARFVTQSVNKGALVRVTRLVDAKQGKPAPGTTLVSTSRQMLEKAMHYDDVPGLPSNNEQIVNFAGTPYNVEQGSNASFHWTPCNFFNHSGSPNVVISLPPEEDGHVYVVALRDIAAGEELFQDYREFKLQEWFMNMCEDWNLTSTQSLGAQLDGMDSFKSAGGLGKVSLPTLSECGA